MPELEQAHPVIPSSGSPEKFKKIKMQGMRGINRFAEADISHDHKRSRPVSPDAKGIPKMTASYFKEFIESKLPDIEQKFSEE